MFGIKSNKCNNIVFNIWTFYISPGHSPGSYNQEADTLRYTNADFKISPYVCVHMKIIP